LNKSDINYKKSEDEMDNEKTTEKREKVTIGGLLHLLLLAGGGVVLWDSWSVYIIVIFAIVFFICMLAIAIKRNVG